jgi:hypothetical protein
MIPRRPAIEVPSLTRSIEHKPQLALPAPTERKEEVRKEIGHG